MKYCQHCGKELLDEAVVCPGCGCAVGSGGGGGSNNNLTGSSLISYEAIASRTLTTNIISLVLLILAIIVGLFWNAWIGAVLSLAAEIVALIPRERLRSALKKNGLTKADKAKKKEIMKGLRKQFPGLTVAFVLAIICLAWVVLVLSVI